MTLPGIGTVDIVPGGTDLETLAVERARQEQALAAQLQALGAPSVAEVEARAHSHGQLVAQVQAKQELVKAYAPDGVGALEAELASAHMQLQVAEQKLADLPPLPDGSQSFADLPTAERAADEAREALASANEAWQQARLNLSGVQADETTARQELEAAQTRVQTADWVRAQAEASVSLADAKALEVAAQAQVDDLARQLQQANLPLLQLDVERLARSVQQIQEGHAERGRRITALVARLEVAGGLGLEEALAEAQQAEQEARRRADDLGRRARALDHLLALLQARRASLAQRLRAPLQKHLNHYLGILFPGARLEVGDDLVPAALTRAGAQGPESGACDDLSVGAREQMGVLARLAPAPATDNLPVDIELPEQDARAHETNMAMSRAEADTFEVRLAAFNGRGASMEGAKLLAEMLVIRDRDRDDRRLCLECSYLRLSGRCVAAATGMLPGASAQLEPVPAILQRCDAFAARLG